jgi:hypothetical protein
VKESDVVILAKVSAARSHLLPKEADIYTEYRATASRVIINRSTWSGPDLAIIHPGGAIQTPTGRILRHLLMGEGAPTEVGGEYLMFLKYSAAAECFQFVKVWQINAGTLRPTAVADTVRATRGESQVAGKPQEAVLNTHARQQQ